MLSQYVKLTPDGPLGHTELPVVVSESGIESRGFAQGAMAHFDWFNDRLQIVVDDGKSDEPTLRIRFNVDGSLEEVLVRDSEVIRKVVGSNQPTKWEKERDDHPVPAPAQLVSQLYSTDTLHVQVPGTIDSKEFDCWMNVVLFDQRTVALGSGIRCTQPRLQLAVAEPDAPRSGAIYDFVIQCLAVDPQPDEFYFYK